jgi:hypothetical protein
MMQESKTFWFPAKKYGWGWGLPATWQGWMVLLVYFVLLVIGSFVFSPATERTMFIVHTAAISVVLVGVCYAKGEPPGWRWGKRRLRQ